MENNQTKVLTLKDVITKEYKTNEIVINGEKFDRTEITKFCLQQAGLTQNMSKMDLMYINKYLEKKQLNPMEGQVSFFKSKNGKICAMPKYTTQLHSLKEQLKKEENYLGAEVKYYKSDLKQPDDLVCQAKLIYKDPFPAKKYDLFLSDWPAYKNLPNCMLKMRKQTWLQLIREYYPELDLGYEEDELETFNSGYLKEKQNIIENKERNIPISESNKNINVAWSKR